MAADASDDDKRDKTQFGIAPPPRLKRTPPAEPAAGQLPTPDPGEGTSHGIAPPPKLPTAQRPGTPPSPPPATPAPTDTDEERTVIVTRKREVTATLQRVQPPGHSEVMRLDRTSYLLGRSHKCDVPLYSPNASREHARLTFRDAAWYVQPLGGKAVTADGMKVGDEQRLTHKMRLQLGGDELLFLDERAAVAPPQVRPTPAAPTGRALRVVLALAAVAALGVVAWWFLIRGARLP